ncbi:hypothetical protein Tco_1394375 [Tanacetum coccineum]
MISLHICEEIVFICSLFSKLHVSDIKQQSEKEVCEVKLTSLAGQYFYSLDDENGNIQSLEMLRHFSFVSQQFGSYSKFKELEGARRLLTFIAIATDVDDR